MKRLLFARIQKTGGTSLHKALATLFPPDRIAPHMHDYQISEAAPEELERYSFFAGHISPGVIREKVDDIAAVTVLREPVGRLISAYGHWHWYGRNMPDDQPEVVRRIGRMSLVEFLADPDLQPCVRNVQHRILHGARFGSTAETRMLVSEASAIPTEFLHVGRTDRLQETADFVAHWLEKPPPTVEWDNRAKMVPAVDNSTYELLEENTRLDTLSYRGALV